MTTTARPFAGGARDAEHGEGTRAETPAPPSIEPVLMLAGPVKSDEDEAYAQFQTIRQVRHTAKTILGDTPEYGVQVVLPRGIQAELLAEEPDRLVHPVWRAARRCAELPGNPALWIDYERVRHSSPEAYHHATMVAKDRIEATFGQRVTGLYGLSLRRFSEEAVLAMVLDAEWPTLSQPLYIRDLDLPPRTTAPEAELASTLDIPSVPFVSGQLNGDGDVLDAATLIRQLDALAGEGVRRVVVWANLDTGARCVEGITAMLNAINIVNGRQTA